jgi:hypothetical protein
MSRHSVKLGVVVAAALIISSLWWALPAETAREAPAPAVAVAAAVGTGFTLQGYLADGGAPATGSYDFEFALFDAAGAGAQIGPTVTLGDQAVTAGYFEVTLNFGTAAFGGGARYLETRVRPGASAGAYTTLSPRRPLTPAPYALALPNVFTNEAENFVGVGRGTRISGNEVFGVRSPAGANDYGGMYIETANAAGWPFYGYATNGSFRAWTYYDGASGDWHLYNAGVRLSVPNEGGLRIGPSADYSLVISNTTGSDGIRIYDTADDGIQIGSDPNAPTYGVYIPSPGVSTYGLWPNTAQASGEWALYTVDNIQAGNVLASGYSLVAQVTGSEALEAGEVVAVMGLVENTIGGTDAVPLVRLADAEQYTGLIGVVSRRLVWELAPGKEAEGAMALQSAPGAAKPGEYVALVVLGVTQVKVAPGAAIVAGQRLTVAATPGQTRAVQSLVVEGVTLSEGAPIIGVALEAPAPGRDTIAVYVNLR